MGHIRQKLQNERGASILLALLFTLICLMVGASVLMAAAANAGKTRSNRQEQQLYLALSSALRTVTDDLTGAAYYGQFAYTKTEEDMPEPAPSPGAGGPGGGEQPKKTTHTYEQKPGKYECGLGDFFAKRLDGLFAAYMEEEQEKAEHPGGDIYTVYKYQPLSSADIGEGDFFLTVTPSLEELKDIVVRIDVSIKDNYRMEFTAGLSALPASYGDAAGYKDYKLEAELTPAGNTPRIPADISADREYQSTPMTWKLGWIVRPDGEEGP